MISRSINADTLSTEHDLSKAASAIWQKWQITLRTTVYICSEKGIIGDVVACTESAEQRLLSLWVISTE